MKHNLLVSYFLLKKDILLHFYLFSYGQMLQLTQTAIICNYMLSML